ncbi:hypothetical protein R3P38DRAFT_3272166 [Favolaschia claudopus]|uniref:F-box domain-containing protein n=1 Tax=Favolaschia claudopus TaxID=2862362 RepID=A0AAW0B3D9_9AGAR
MHRCLAIPEILQLISESLRDDYGRRNLPSLAVLAQTCRSFSPVALAQLWGILSGLDPILHCMPLDLFSRRGKDSWKLQRPIRASDWERPLVYMGLIKDLTIGPSPTVPQIFPALHASLPAEVETCFPRLTRVQWYDDLESVSMRLTLSPRLTQVFMFIGTSHTNFSCLSSIPRLCPGLQEVSLRCQVPDGPSISDFLCRLHSLQRLMYVDIPDIQTLQHLSRLPSLMSMEISLPKILPTTPSPLSFIPLKKLIIWDSGVEGTVNFFTLCTMASLQDLNIPLETRTNIVAIDRLHTALRKSCSHESLKTFSVDYSETDPSELEEPPNTCMIPLHSIQLLFCFANLTTVSITSHLGFHLNDEELKTVAVAWPCLQVLHLRCGELAPYDKPGLSLHSLSTLAKYCVSLKTLTLSLDATSVPDLPSITTAHQPTPQLALRHLDVDRSPISAPSIYVARFLFSFFPNLTTIRTARTFLDNDEPDEPEETIQAIVYYDRWLEVWLQLPVLKAVREEGWAKAQAELGTRS